MKRLIGIAATVLIAGGATAQQATPGNDMPGKNMGPGMDMDVDKKMVLPNATETQSTGAYEAVMIRMMMERPKFTGDADIDFMKLMRPHHQAAIDMAKVVIANGKDAEIKKLAQDIIFAQENEIAMIDAWLKKNGS